MGVTAISPSAPTTFSMARCSAGLGNPVSRQFTMSWARSRSSITITLACVPSSASFWLAASASWPASNPGDGGWLRPADTTPPVPPALRPPPPCAASSGLRQRGNLSLSTGQQQGLADGKRRAIRHVRRAQRIEFLAQDRDHLAAQHVQLLEHSLQRQSGMIHQEQLTLVIAEMLPERQRPVDDLLRAAHGEGGLLDEVFHRRSVPVHGRIVEIGPELPDCVLGVPAHEHLAAETDDCLLGRAMAVMRESLPVEADEPDEVPSGPENMVCEEPVAVIGGLLGDLRA